LDHIARLHPQRRGAAGADAAWRAGDDHVARLEPREGRAVFDLARDIENHLADEGILNHLAVEPGLQPERSELAGLVGGDHPWAKGASIRKVLARRELVGVALIIAHAALVVTGISCDMAPRILTRDVTASLADDDREFALVVEVGRHFRPDDVGKM